MKMDRRLTNGLAWAGALLVIGIPAADYITGALAGAGTPNIAVVDAEPVSTPTPASTTPAPVAATEAPKPAAATKPQAVASTGGAVDGFLQSGKPLPSYITGGDAPATAAPAKPATTPAAPVVKPPVQAVTTPAPVTTTPAPVGQVAALPPAKVAPTPMPLSMRPQPVTVPLASNQPLIIDQPTVAPIVPVQQQPNDLVTSEDLDDWESGPLNEFLARRGQQSSATYRVQQNQPVPQDNGFWLDEGPRNNRPVQGYPQVDEDVYFTPF
jgi:hypothetical protein